MTGRPAGPDVEPPELSWLRAYSNYLTPRVGVGSADAWAALAIYARNLLLNWLVLIPVLCLALLLLQMVATVSFGVACDPHFVQDHRIACGEGDWGLLLRFGVAGAAFLVVGQAFTRHRPPRRAPRGTGPSTRGFVLGDLVWNVLAAILMTLVFSSHVVVDWIAGPPPPLNDPPDWNYGLVPPADWNAGPINVPLANSSVIWKLAALALAGAFIFAAGWIVGWLIQGSWRAIRRGSWRDLGPASKDLVCWALSGIAYGGLIGLGAVSFALLQPYGEKHPNFHTLLPMILGIPWALASQLAAEAVFVGLTSYGKDSDSDREWLGRAGGFTAAAAVGWAVTAFLSVGVGHYIIHPDGLYLKPLTASLGAISGVASVLLGKSGLTPATTDDGRPGIMALLLNFVLAVAGPVFVAALVVGLSVALDQILFGNSLVSILHKVEATQDIFMRLAIGVFATAVIGGIASWNVNINRFSLHAVYRNRLVRCYLGATRQTRKPDLFTGFDDHDNLAAATLWPPKAAGRTNTFGLFHVVNIALNVVETKRLAWQERKAEPFTVSALHCGSAYKGFRPTAHYGGRTGLTLGTAMAISGAAVSPNMGYSSSPSIALLLTLFNVRLGWWLGNPGRVGEKSYRTEGPSFAVTPLLEEGLGLTTDSRPYVYLSDGGHFEDLGLYEMVRRRCQFIVVVDAGEDGKFAFEDLGNAVRKIYIDLGVRIEFRDLDRLTNRPDPKIPRDDREKIPYHAIGVIRYEEADLREAGCDDEIILYIKPALHWTEAAGIVSYANAHPDFPHETTTDQWFTKFSV